MSKVLPPATTAQLSLYFLRPKLEYASPVWHGNLLEWDAMAIERVQTAVARSILCDPFRTSKTDLFEQFNWPSLSLRREIASNTLFHKLQLTRPPPLDSCLFPFASTLSGRSMRKPHQLILPEAHTSKYINSFFYRSSLVGTLSQQLFSTSHVIKRLRKKLKKIGQHICTPPKSIQFRKFTKPPRSQQPHIKDNIILPFCHPISTVGLLNLILDLLLFPPPLLADLSSHLTYSLLFHLSYIEQVFLYRSL